MKMISVHCPHCGEIMNGLEPVNDPQAQGPKLGDRTLCTMCAGVGLWDTVDDELTLRAPTADEQPELDADHQLQAIRRVVLSRLN